MRNILVGLKRVVDYNVRVRVKPDGTGVATEGAKMSINPFDEIALEEALRIRERGEAESITVVSIGPTEIQQQLRTGLAMGADRAVAIESEQALEPLTIARALLALVERDGYELVLLGKQAIDSDDNQTGQMLAALWGRPQATFASKIEFSGSSATVTREVDAGLETIGIELPAVITSDLRLNEPRYIKLPEILKAKSKPLEVLSLDALGVETKRQFTVVETAPPPPREPGIKVDNGTALVAELVRRGLI